MNAAVWDGNCTYASELHEFAELNLAESEVLALNLARALFEPCIISVAAYHH
jgi:hypothetical protein